ncbi:hypothetical protein [Chryseobacterium luquanense]|uniref:DUF4943 domain-containing protein n=1 Tax=Chryseobacterium luquanense TaxID=2983766 RepID=A0ABT3Y5R5_9FLAO|nr:hypothetical protein [Chryseobacterium luquanense]MCX8533489.1 hypothetical protein [Chryseobacterium luquanense]
MKTKLIILLGFFYFTSCMAQIPDEPMTIAEYPTFYTQTVNKLNNIIPNKANYYGQPLSVFLQALSQNNIIVKKYEPGPFNGAKLLKLSFFWNMDVRKWAMDGNYAEPQINIYFQQPFNYQQAMTMMSTNGYHSYWNPQAENFFKDLVIEKIEFWYVRGLTDNSANPK